MLKTNASRLRLTLICAAVSLLGACSQPSDDRMSFLASPEMKSSQGIDPSLKSKAIAEVKAKQAKGQRVWCVPFARTLSGVNLRGNAGTWWKSAEGAYQRSKAPVPGAVMAFASTRKNPMGHVAVVNEIQSERRILIDHANWSRNKLSLGMAVVDVSPKNDWSQVRLESNANGAMGSTYPIHGFILPKPAK